MPETGDAIETQATWDDFFVHNPASRHRRRFIKDLIRRYCPHPRSILDVGCADGRLLEELRTDFGARITGIEPHRAEAPERLKGAMGGFHSFSIEESYIRETFDLVVMTEVLEHTRDDGAALDNLARMTAGHLLLTVPAGPLLRTDVTMGHIRHYTPEGLRALAERHGFKTVACFAWGFPFHSLYRYLVDVFAGPVTESFGKRRYGLLQKAIAKALHLLFFLNSGNRGNQLFYLGKNV